MKRNSALVLRAWLSRDQTIHRKPIDQSHSTRVRHAERATHLLDGHAGLMAQQRDRSCSLTFFRSVIFCLLEDRVCKSENERADHIFRLLFH